MDTVYGTKKYFQSLSGASDIYRSPTVAACRTMTNDFSYQNTLGRRSTLGAYYHMNKQPSYTNDHSVNSQYGYSTWGIWRDGRNMAPSTYSVKPYHHYQKTKSFSIILTTAAFIVLLAVITIAGLAFYFSSIKTGSEEPVIGFEGSFRIAKGDLFSTGLKFNHTSSYKQKVEFYKRFVERALTDTGLHPLRTDIWGFGEGPLIRVFFRTFLDVRKLPQNIHSVEDYIKEAFILQTTSFKSLYRSLRIDNDSVDIKRILDEQIVKSASIYKDMHGTPTSQTQLEKRLLKKSGTAISSPKPASNVNKPRIKPHSVDDEPDVDVENAPVIQGSFEGSFEITKTDADIARRRTTPTRQQHTTYSSSLPPKTVTPYSLRVKPRKPGVEKLTTIIPQSLATATTAAKTTTTLTIKPVAVSSTTTTGKPATKLTNPTTTTTTIVSTSPTTTTATAATTTTTKATTTRTTKTTTTTKPTTTTTTKAPTTPTTTAKSIKSSPPTSTLLTFDTTNYASNDYFTYPSLTSTTAAPLNILKMDTNLFTSIPVLDTQPWKPIHREVPEFLPGPPPTFPTKSLISTTAINNLPPQRRHDEMELPSLPDEPQPPKLSLYDTYSNSYVESNLRKSQLGKPTVQDLMFYHSYGNPIFMDGTQGIERLGVGASIQPHPLPVPLIDEVVVPPFKPLNADVKSSESVPFGIDESDEKFEHLGDGVIAKRQENISSLTLTTTPATTLKVFKVNGQKSTTIIPLTTSTKALPVSKESMMKDIKLTTTEKSVVGDVLKAVSPSTELAESIGQFFMGLLNLTAEESIKNNKSLGQSLEGRIEPEEAVLQESDNNSQTHSSMEYKLQATPTTNKPSFLNIKELILKRNQENKKKEVEEMQQQQKVQEEPEQLGQQVTQTTPVLKLQTTMQTTRPADTTPSTLNPTEKSLMTTPTMTTTTTTSRTTTKRIRIKPTYNTSTILDDSNLFPSHTKWEFVNSSALNDYGHNGNMRKIFNNTLQAWVSVDVDKSENLTLNVIKNKINNATNIQDISLIFDTLASKLGITPSIPAKEPPFSHNKLMQTLKNETPTKMNNFSTNLIPKRTTATTTTATTTTTTTTVTPPPPPATTIIFTTTTSPKPRFTPTEKSTTSTSTLRYEEVFYKEKREPDYVQPFMGYGEDTSSEGIGAAIPVVGEAEVEVIDPTKYEEMLLKSSQFAESPTTEIIPKLVTLLPVRSNSGIRTYKPPNTSDSSRSSAEDLITRKPTHSANHRSSNRKTHNGQERRFPPSETVIRGGFIVKSHYD